MAFSVFNKNEGPVFFEEFVFTVLLFPFIKTAWRDIFTLCHTHTHRKSFAPKQCGLHGEQLHIIFSVPPHTSINNVKQGEFGFMYKPLGTEFCYID